MSNFCVGKFRFERAPRFGDLEGKEETWWRIGSAIERRDSVFEISFQCIRLRRNKSICCLFL